MLETCQKYLKFLCEELPQRPVGSEGNRLATSFFGNTVKAFGWDLEETEFSALDWQEEGAELQVEGVNYQVYPSPYAQGCDLRGRLAAAGTLEELETCQGKGNILLIHGELAREQLMPKNFVFYNPEEHQRIISLLEEIHPAAILSATSRNAALAGGVYPFPLIEDGDFNIPSVYLTEENGLALLQEVGKDVSLISRAMRIPALGYNLVARKGHNPSFRYVISAHIDAKIGTPGAIDNGTGIIILLLLAELLDDYAGNPTIELLPFNGEDYYAASGQMIYLQQNQDKFDEIQLNINIDGAGYHLGPSAFSPFDLNQEMGMILAGVLDGESNLVLGEPWVQGDHSIFLQQGVPAIAVSSKWFIDNMESQTITHTPKDHSGIVNCQRLIEIALAIHQIILKLTDESPAV